VNDPMPEASAMKIVACVLALALLGAVTPRESFAGDASGDHGGVARARPMFRPHVAGRVEPRRPADIGVPKPGERNAIGVSTVQPAAVRISEPTAAANPPGGLRTLPAVERGPIRPAIAHPSFVAAAPAMTHSEINGTTLIRRASAPLPFGGPAKSAAGINGSTFHPKH
jgi:hypothetical protein